MFTKGLLQSVRKLRNSQKEIKVLLCKPCYLDVRHDSIIIHHVNCSNLNPEVGLVAQSEFDEGLNALRRAL